MLDIIWDSRMKVTYIDHMGTDLSVVQAAKVSFKKNAEEVSEKDITRLINYLARGCDKGSWLQLLSEAKSSVDTLEDTEKFLEKVKHIDPHWTPFGHTAVTLHLKIPFFVANQIKKHQVGFVVNEVSRRYVDDPPEFYFPDYFRKRSPNKKQGSLEEEVENIEQHLIYHCKDALTLYDFMIAKGVAPELARMVLPQNTYTEFYMTGNLYSWANLYNKRTGEDAQKETKEVALQVGDIIKPLLPISWEALTRKEKYVKQESI